MNGCAPGLTLIERLKATRKWAIDSCQNKVSADRYNMAISWAQVKGSLRLRVF